MLSRSLELNPPLDKRFAPSESRRKSIRCPVRERSPRPYWSRVSNILGSLAQSWLGLGSWVLAKAILQCQSSPRPPLFPLSLRWRHCNAYHMEAS